MAARGLECNSSVPDEWSRDALIVRTRHMVLCEDVLSWLTLLEQSNQCWLKTWRAGWRDLNNQTSVDWRRAELDGLTWTIKPVLTEDVPSWLAWLEQSNQCWLKTCQAGWRDLNNQTSVDWRRAELSWLAWLWRVKWNGLSMPVHLLIFFYCLWHDIDVNIILTYLLLIDGVGYTCLSCRSVMLWSYYFSFNDYGCWISSLINEWFVYQRELTYVGYNTCVS